MIAGWIGSTAAEGFKAFIILELMRPSVLEIELDKRGVNEGDDAGNGLPTVKASEVVLHKLRLYLPEGAAWKNPSLHSDTGPGRLMIAGSQDDRSSPRGTFDGTLLGTSDGKK